MKTKKQVLVNRKGDIYLGERPAPELTPVSVLVETKFSMISPGTEISVMKGFIGAADDDEVIGLGYSASGVVVEVGSEVSGLKVGDRIGSYGGPYTTHSSILGVPQTLCAKIPENVSLEEAAFCGLGAIAMHGVRKGGVMLGDNVVVVGLGPIGQLASQIATAAGDHVIAIVITCDNHSNMSRLIITKSSTI
jgi:NADPH:quinone reductase-like Zn-dependent oxidoreductase